MYVHCIFCNSYLWVWKLKQAASGNCVQPSSKEDCCSRTTLQKCPRQGEAAGHIPRRQIGCSAKYQGTASPSCLKTDKTSVTLVRAAPLATESWLSTIDELSFQYGRLQHGWVCGAFPAEPLRGPRDTSSNALTSAGSPGWLQAECDALWKTIKELQWIELLEAWALMEHIAFTVRLPSVVRTHVDAGQNGPPSWPVGISSVISPGALNGGVGMAMSWC